MSLHYDPMLAKLITYAPDRGQAIAAQAEALDRFVIDGVAHNLMFLGAIMDHPRWQAGTLSTHFIAEEFPQGFAPRAPEGEMGQAFVCVAASIDHVIETRAWKGSGQALPQGRVLAIFLGGRRFDVRCEAAGEGLFVHFGENLSLCCRFDWAPGRILWEGTIDGRVYRVQVRALSGGYRLAHRGIEAEARVLTLQAAELAACLPAKQAARAEKLLLSPMPGLLKQIHVAAGQKVAAGDALCMIEAMKMENVLRAEADGIVKAIHVTAGELLRVDAPIMEFE